MKKIKQSLIIFLIIILSIVFLSSGVNAATVNIRAQNSKVTVDDTVSVTVSFGEKVDTAQFKLNYDTSKFKYVSVSAGTYAQASNRYAYINWDNEADLSSVTFRFKAISTGTGTFNVSKVVLSSNSTSIGSSVASVTVVAKSNQDNEQGNNPGSSTQTKPGDNSGSSTQTKPGNNSGSSTQTKPENNSGSSTQTKPGNNSGSSTQTKPGNNSGSSTQTKPGNNSGSSTQTKPSSNSGSSNKKPSTSSSSNTTKKPSNQNTTDSEKNSNDEDTDAVETLEKTELDLLKQQLVSKVESDYTLESWTTLKDIISKAENASNEEEYNEIKEQLNLDVLVPAEFEKTELDNLLEELSAKRKEDYTSQSWGKLQNIILSAQNAKLKSEYDAIKGSLTTNMLEEVNNSDIVEISKKRKNDYIFISIIAIIIIIFAMCIILFHGRNKKKEQTVVGNKQTKKEPIAEKSEKLEENVEKAKSQNKEVESSQEKAKKQNKEVESSQEKSVNKEVEAPQEKVNKQNKEVEESKVKDNKVKSDEKVKTEKVEKEPKKETKTTEKKAEPKKVSKSTINKTNGTKKASTTSQAKKTSTKTTEAKNSTTEAKKSVKPKAKESE